MGGVVVVVVMVVMAMVGGERSGAWIGGIVHHRKTKPLFHTLEPDRRLFAVADLENQLASAVGPEQQAVQGKIQVCCCPRSVRMCRGHAHVRVCCVWWRWFAMSGGFESHALLGF